MNIHYLGTTNAMKMKLGTFVYLHGTFDFGKYWGLAHRGYEGVVQELPKSGTKLKNFPL